MTFIQKKLQQVRKRIAVAAAKCGRNPQEIVLLAVSKTKSVNCIVEALMAGQHAFGENYVQEGVSKILLLLPTSWKPEWHFIGPLQSNKSRLVAENFSWCHTVDCLRIAIRLNNQRPPYLPPLNVLIQVNISSENTKSGIMFNDIPKLAQTVATLPHLRLRGLMAIPAPEKDYQRQLIVFQHMKNAIESLKKHYPSIDTLSLGMSNDMESAIAAGSTLVRIGTAIFGMRN